MVALNSSAAKIKAAGTSTPRVGTHRFRLPPMGARQTAPAAGTIAGGSINALPPPIAAACGPLPPLMLALAEEEAPLTLVAPLAAPLVAPVLAWYVAISRTCRALSSAASVA